MEGLATVPVDAHVGRRAGLLLSDAKASGLTVGIADAIIAATALMLDVPLLTNNVRHYLSIPGLDVVKGAPA
ncbi:MAG: PIN domain-containing protein [Chloroflexi bacterium]|nr:PIN domain-containing protein [Chloroflexota bacterium]